MRKGGKAKNKNYSLFFKQKMKPDGASISFSITSLSLQSNICLFFIRNNGTSSMWLIKINNFNYNNMV
jgi:hypothetical protein